MMYSKFYKIIMLALVAGLVSGCGDEGDGSTFGTVGTGGGNSITPSEPIGIIAGDGFFMLFNPAVLSVIAADFPDNAYIQQESTITVFADNIFDGVAPSGQIVKFKTEWGTFVDGDTCTLESGSCSITWSSGAPWSTPPDCRVAFTAWTIGEEVFADTGNGLFDAGETLLLDYPEPVLDVDSDGFYNSTVITFEGVPEFIDMNVINGDTSAGGGKDGIFTPADGLYSGTLCASDNTANCTINTSRVIFAVADLFLADPGTVAAPGITVCNTGSY